MDSKHDIIYCNISKNIFEKYNIKYQDNIIDFSNTNYTFSIGRYEKPLNKHQKRRIERKNRYKKKTRRNNK